MITVVLVDDQVLFRSGLRMVLESQPDIAVLGEAGDGRSAIEVVTREQPQIVLMDLSMPGMSGIDAICALRDLAGDAATPRMIALTTFDFDDSAARAIEAGAAGFLLKDAAPEFVLATIRQVAAGGSVIASAAASRLLDGSATRESARVVPRAYTTLTDRERDIFLLVARGLSNAEIAAAEFVSEATVKTHISRILAKLGLRDRVQIVVFAFEHEIVRP